MPRVLRSPPALGAATRLQLMWLASPALPVGGFSYSEVLESAIEAGRVTNEHEAQRWLTDQLHLSLARADLPVLGKALSAWCRGDLARVTELNQWVTQTRETSELRLQTEQMGRSLLEWLRNRSGDARHAPNEARLAQCAALQPTPTWPITFALAVALSLPASPLPGGTGGPARAALEEALLSFAFTWAENMVQAALKAVPLGQSAGQRILQALIDQIPPAIAHALDLPDSERQAFTPMLAILSAQHETQYSRLFRS